MILTLLLAGMVASNVNTLPWNGPQQTGFATSTANWSPAPTNFAKSYTALKLRSLYPVSVCGWIGGNVQMPAYCSTQSSCVWNSDNEIVGCCATTESNKCKFYTSCVDMNSPKQTEDKDDVYTCEGTSVCYSNTYPQGYKQWGCGYSNWATFVATSYTGMMGQSLQMATTGNEFIESQFPTAISSSPSKDTITIVDSSSPATAQTTTTSSSLTAIFTPLASDNATAAEISNVTKKAFPTGPVIGGAVGSILFFCFIASVALVARRKGCFNKKHWRGKKKEPVIFFEPSQKQHDPPMKPQEDTVHIDSNPVYELGGENIYKAAYKKDCQPERSPESSPIVSPLIHSPSTFIREFEGNWSGMEGDVITSVRPVSEMG